MSAIEVNHLTKKFGDKIIFNDLNFAVQENEFVAIIGPSGSGKSTLLNILGMLEPVDKGEIKIFNQKLPQVNSNQATMLRRNTINYLFQSFALINNKTVLENLLLALNFSKMSTRQKRDAIKKVLADLDLAGYDKRQITSLSGGEQQRIALARVILKPGKLVLADEPTGALDPQHEQEAFNMIKQLRDQYHKTVILVTHNLKEAEQADHLIKLK